ncbi:hypothetical protein B0T11DRAFT_353176 [Plectosphaerella cucumerina]|uniref:2EXR domain-containing protein n=1 Tax=Plectosphaerella cucumerina TaxID=40658 RepID=A0A8K0X5Q8_9PEZI|nr:hypothetical protein B0T11DRAFT_353176 [Plectosphaerella cucumerina]
MPGTDSFILFPCLPPEIRLQIWRDALLVPAVWFAIDESADADHGSHQHDHDRASCPDVTMVPLQSACSSHWVGQACVESRRLAEALRGPFPQKPCFAWDRRLFYTDWDRATVFFGNGSNAAQVLEALPEKEKALFRHVAVQFESQSNVEEFINRLRRCNPDIRTISVFIDTDFPCGPEQATMSVKGKGRCYETSAAMTEIAQRPKIRGM